MKKTVTNPKKHLGKRLRLTESRYRTRRAAVCAVEREVGEMAADHDLNPTEAVFRGPDEWTLPSRSGEEIALDVITRIGLEVTAAHESV